MEGGASVTVFYLVKNASVKLKKDSPGSQKALYPTDSFLQLNFSSSVQIASAQLWEDIILVLGIGRNVYFSSSRNWKLIENNWQESKYSHLGRHQTWEISGQGSFLGKIMRKCIRMGFFSFFLFFFSCCFLLFNGDGKCSIRGDSTYKLSNHFFLMLVLQILHLLLSIKVTDSVSLNRNYIPVSLPKAQIWDRVSEKNTNMRDSGTWQRYRLCFFLINNLHWVVLPEFVSQDIKVRGK